MPRRAHRRTTCKQETERYIKSEIKRHDKEVTDAYGKIDFGGSAITPAKYVRVAQSTKVEVLYKLLVDHWKLKTPNLIISITGGAKNFKLRARLKEVFQKSLIKVAKKTSAWITTGGTHAGVMKHVGKAVENYGTICDGHEKVVTIGIASWGAIFGNEKLVNEDKEKQSVKQYDAEESEQGTKVILDNNHSHFILVDDGKEGEKAYGGEIQLRADLESFIASKKTKNNLNVMIVCVIVQGGPGSLETVACSVQNGTPVVIVEGSSGWADILAEAYKSGDESFDTDWVKNQLPKETASKADTATLEKWTARLNTCISQRNLLHVFSLNPSGTSWDLDVAILQSLLNAHKSDHSNTEQQAYDQLKLMMAWNRSDIAKSHILDEETKIQKKDIAKLFFTAIEQNKHDFCKVLLDYGVNLKKYFTVEKFKRLYNDSDLIKKWEEIDKCVEIHRIGKIMKEFLGHSYDVSIYNDTKDSTKYSTIVHSEGKLEDPYREIFQWAILMNYREIARHIWEYMFESMSAAIMATKMLKRMAKKEKKDSEKRKQMISDADEYEELAAGIQRKCFSDDPNNAVDLLTAGLPGWGGYSCLQIAAAADDKHFLSMPGVCQFLEHRWMGEIAAETSTARIILVGICPFFLFTIRRRNKKREPEGRDECGENAGRPPSRHDLEPADILKYRMSVGSLDERCSLRWSPVTFYKAPIVKFWMNVVFFLIYLMLFSFIILSKFDIESVTASAYEYALFAWMITLSFEEIRELHGQRRNGLWKKFKLHIRDPWNVMDILSMILFYVGFGLRFDERFLDWALVLYSCTFMIHCVRIVHIFAVHHVLGPKIIMVWKMLKDLLFFLFILIVFLLAYGVASQALLYPGETGFVNIIVGIVYRPYWQIYGELFLDEIHYNPNATEFDCSNTDASLPRCPRRNTVVPVLSAVYLLLANVLLLNLLIAMFSYSFEDVQSRSNEIWMFERYKLIASYHFRPPWVPPLIIISHVIRFGKLCLGKKSTDEFDCVPLGTLREERMLKLRKWERWRAEEFIRKRHEEANLKFDRGLENLATRIDNIMLTAEDLQSRLKRLESRLPGNA